MKQKLVTIYLDNSSYGKGKMIVGSFADKHCLVEEHLHSYLDDGWRIGSVGGFGGHSDGITTSGWFAIVLEK